jgi:hypothetical protein
MASVKYGFAGTLPPPPRDAGFLESTWRGIELAKWDLIFDGCIRIKDFT